MPFVVFLVLFFSISEKVYGFCGTIEEDTKVVLSPSREIRFLKRGEMVLVKGVTRDQSKFILEIYDESAPIPVSFVQMMSRRECKAIFPSANINFEWSSAHKKPVVSEPPPEPVIVVKPEVTKPEPVVVKPEPVVPKPERRREVRRQSPDRPSRQTPQEWRFGVETGMAFHVSSEEYKGLITKIPDPNNVAALQDPLITDVKTGQGYFLRGFAEKHLNPDWLLQVGGAYRSHTFKYSAKKNPSPPGSVVGLDELSTHEVSFDEKMIELGGGFVYLYPLSSLKVGIGAQADLLYSLTGKRKIDVLLPTGVVFKNTPGEVSAGPDTVGYQIKGKLDLRGDHFRATLSFSTDASVLLSLGYLW